jgi:malic enzyme
METVTIERDAAGQVRMRVPYRGAALLRQPLYAKGSGFSAEERRAFGLEGLLPPHVSTMAEQSRRAYENIARKQDPLEKYIGLAALQDRNEHLFYRVLADHIEELLPIVYTPVVGRACQEFSHIFRRARGLWITPDHRGRIDEVLGHAPYADVRLVVATDNERILGLGDQGAGGMGIPIGKLALYTAAAGIPPWQTLPVSLDVGTDNQALLEDDLYLGWRSPRLRGQEYDNLLDEFVAAVRRRFPRALLQWEDFKKGNAFRVLDRYRARITCFNDDIQGTAAVAVAGLLAGARATETPVERQRVVILGAGAAGIGIARLVRDTLRAAGLSGPALAHAIATVDVEGLVVDGAALDAHQRDFAWPPELAARHGLGEGRARDLQAVVRAVKPTLLIGTSGQPGAFTEDVVREMARHVVRPVVLPMSNPTSKTEALPADIVRWTEGRALVGTGSPFDAVTWQGRAIAVGQSNNAYVFPGVGLGVLVSEASAVTDSMFAAAARQLASEVSGEALRDGRLFPPIAEIRRVTVRVAGQVVRAARDCGVGRWIDDGDVERQVSAAMWEPSYVPLLPAPAPESATEPALTAEEGR